MISLKKTMMMLGCTSLLLGVWGCGDNETTDEVTSGNGKGDQLELLPCSAFSGECSMMPPGAAEDYMIAPGDCYANGMKHTYAPNYCFVKKCSKQTKENCISDNGCKWIDGGPTGGFCMEDITKECNLIIEELTCRLSTNQCNWNNELALCEVGEVSELASCSSFDASNCPADRCELLAPKTFKTPVTPSCEPLLNLACQQYSAEDCLYVAKKCEVIKGTCTDIKESEITSCSSFDDDIENCPLDRCNVLTLLGRKVVKSCTPKDNLACNQYSPEECVIYSKKCEVIKGTCTEKISAE